MNNRTAIIVVDSGFSAESIQGANSVLGLIDLSQSTTIFGAPYVEPERLLQFAGDPQEHGSEVLKRLRELSPGAFFVLVRAFDGDDNLVRTRWADGRRVTIGWTEAYLSAVRLCTEQGLNSVANFSFGGFAHAMDGTGWESMQLGLVSGPGKPGHVTIAAAGPGDGRAAHASWQALPDDRDTICVYQKHTTSYNFWVETSRRPDWELEIRMDGKMVHSYRGHQIRPNFWNNRQQLTFDVEGSGSVLIHCRRLATTNSSSQSPLRFDCWLRGQDSASFLDHVDSELIAEPAIFPHVISAGLAKNKYSPRQLSPNGKPDILLGGTGMISFRLPEVTAAATTILNHNPRLDATGVRTHLQKKFPKH